MGGIGEQRKYIINSVKEKRLHFGERFHDESKGKKNIYIYMSSTCCHADILGYMD